MPSISSRSAIQSCLLLLAALALSCGLGAGCVLEQSEPAAVETCPEVEPAPQLDTPAEQQLPELVRPDGSYAVAELAKSAVVLKVVQSNAKAISSVSTAAATIAANLEHVLSLGQQACTEGDKPDILLFHEFPFSGYVYGDRQTKLDVALEIPGPETAAMGELAKSCDSYVIFGSYVKDAEWPGHVLSITTIINRAGEVVKTVWKPRNIKRFYSTFEITTTTVESVRSKFRAKYGVEEELPVVRTEFGNIAVSTAQLDPLVFAALAMQGAEIILRTSTLFFEHDVVYTAQVNNVYSAMANIPYDSQYGGGSMIVGPDGNILTKVQGNTKEGIATAKIPIAAFRANRRIPQFCTELTQTVLGQYVPEIPLDHLDLPPDQLPQDGKEMKSLLDSISRWLN